MRRIVTATRALTDHGWREKVAVEIGLDGTIAAIRPTDGPAEHDVLLPAPGNLHSHAFQRAMAGLTEERGGDGTDSFWTWRRLMYRFLDRLTPDHVEAIAAFAQMEMLEAGYGAVGEFHYLHHRPDGRPYDRIAEMAERIAAAAEQTGIGLTLLPVLYQQGGLDGRPLEGGQRRFGCDLDRFAALEEAAETACARLTNPAIVGVAPHSLRAVSAESLSVVSALRSKAPCHIHIAEQTAEVEAVEAHTGTRPVAWLLENLPIDRRWCLVHATHMMPDETRALARSGAVVGLCPVTEASLGDGIFDGVRYRDTGGVFGIGTDSNIRISLIEELRTLDYSQRYRDGTRAALAEEDRSTGRTLFDGTARGGAQALGRDSGALAPGRLADMLALRTAHPDLEGLAGDRLLDAWIFAGGDRAVDSVWSAGRPLVERGRHFRHDEITDRYRAVLQELRIDL
ncbi:MAG: formimidoylglutamate deiminase [Alphaproteobacteria bacterium]|nr:formimidoylglutamate deiminase [Alphaproteobacteria bacterium]